MDKITEEISSLEEYISVIKKYDLGNQYLRGENQKYTGITSSLIRSYKPLEKNIGLQDIYQDLLNMYYREVGYKLDKQQEENFLAFSQHHGLKTNLVDFTTAPLVALYFACEREKYDADCGFVYVLNKENTVDASKFLRKYSIEEHLCYNVFEQLAKKDSNIIADFKNLIIAYAGILSGKNPHELVNLISCKICQNPELENCNLYLKEKTSLQNQLIEKLGKNNADLEKISQDKILTDILLLIEKYVPELNGMGSSVYINEFVGLLILFLNDLRNCSEKHPAELEFPTIPYFMYKTPLKFDRIKNQNGIFLYQAFMDYSSDDYDAMNGFMVQKINPDIVIQIKNQKEIIKELEMFGINKRYIYGDFDSTAQYINKKFFSG